MEALKVPFAYDDINKIVDVKTAQKGIDYKCSCGGVLRLRSGEKVRAHFYHVDPTKCSYESAIHKAYKTVFKQLKYISLPYGAWEKEWSFDYVELEKKFDDIVADAVGYIGSQPFLIEFANTHEIGPRKLAKLKKIGIPCLEVYIKGKEKTVAGIISHLRNDQFSKNLCYDPRLVPVEDFEKKVAEVVSKNYKNLTEMKDRYEKEIWDLGQENAELLQKNFLSRGRGGKQYVFLQFHKKCKNGALMYKNQDHNEPYVVFINEKGRELTIKIG